MSGKEGGKEKENGRCSFKKITVGDAGTFDKQFAEKI